MRQRSFTSVVLPAPFSPTIATTEPGASWRSTSSSTRRSRARVGERDVLEADALRRAARAPPRRAPVELRRGVVLEPGQPARAVEPDAAQEADLADRRADVGRQPRARREHQQHVARRRAGGRTTRTPRRRRSRRRRPPSPPCARPRCPGGPRPRAVPALPRLAPRRREALADAASRAPPCRAARSWRCRTGGAPAGSPTRRAPRRRAPRPAARSTSARSAARTAASSAERRVDRHQQRERHARAAGSSRRS